MCQIVNVVGNNLDVTAVCWNALGWYWDIREVVVKCITEILVVRMCQISSLHVQSDKVHITMDYHVYVEPLVLLSMHTKCHWTSNNIDPFICYSIYTCTQNEQWKSAQLSPFLLLIFPDLLLLLRITPVHQPPSLSIVDLSMGDLWFRCSGWGWECVPLAW